MLTKILTSAFVIFGSIVGMTAVSPAVGTLASSAAVTVNVPPVEAAPANEAVAPSQMGANAVARAHALAVNSTTNLTSALIAPHAFNYTGFVGYVWKLPVNLEQDYMGWSQEVRMHQAVEISSALLEPGDVLANGRGGDFGQAIVFEKWEDVNFWRNVVDPTDPQAVNAEFASGVKFVAFVMTGAMGDRHVQEKHLTLRVMHGAISIQELEQAAVGPYFALRNKGIKGFVTVLDSPIVLNRVKAGSHAYVEYSIINRGGSPVQVSQMGAVAYGPDADAQGLASMQTNFQVAPNLTLEPGEVHTYKQELTLSQAGEYFVLPKFQVDGVMQVPMEKANFQVIGN